MIQKRLALVGLAKQTAKGSAAANPTYDFGLLDGSAFDGEIGQDREEITLDTLTSPGVNRTTFDPGADFSTRAYPQTTPLLLFGALGAIATSGPVATVYTHIITPGTDMSYFTLFGRQGSDYVKVADCKLDELTLSFDGAGPIELKTTWLGLEFTWLASAWAPGTAVRDSSGKLRGGGGTFQLMTNGDALVSASVKAGELTIASNIDAPHLANSIKPSDVVPGEKEITLATTLVPEDLLLWRRILTGTPGGTTISEAEIYGQFSYKFMLDANNDLTIAALRVGFSGDFPEADAAGGALELELEGVCVNQAAGGVPITATMRNTIASY